MAAFSAIGVIMHDLSLAVVEELKYILKNRKEKTNRELFCHFKERMAKVVEELKVKWKEIISGSFEAGIMAFMSNIVEALAKPRAWEGQRPRCPRFAVARATRTLPLPGFASVS